MIRTDCRYYKATVPCLFHRRYGTLCVSCEHYDRLSGRILIIKLGAAGDVIRTTPLLRRIKDGYPRHEISWLTYFPDVLPGNWVDNILKFSIQNVLWLKEQAFDWVINLDKDREALTLAKGMRALRKSGFTMDRFGKCAPISNNAEKHKWLMGTRDDLNRANTMNYMEEIFQICGYHFNDEKYILDIDAGRNWSAIDKSTTVVGLNTGCGKTWISRLWAKSRWVKLAGLLKDDGLEVILLGGPDEDRKNKEIARKSGTRYLGHFPLKTFFSLVNECDILVSQVSMAAHVAIALDKKIVLMNNIFNRNEFYLYGNGILLEPDRDCLGCYKSEYDEDCPDKSCMELITAETVYDNIQSLYTDKSQQLTDNAQEHSGLEVESCVASAAPTT